MENIYNAKFGVAILLLQLITSSFIFAQYNDPTEKGYIINKKNDTISGEFSYVKARKLFHEVSFKKEGSESYYIVNADSVKGFYLAAKNQLFVSGKYHAFGVKDDSFRMAIITTGGLIFYTGKGETGKSTFWASKGDTLRELVKVSEKTVNIAGGVYKTKERPYLNVLTKLTGDCLHERPDFELTYFQLKRFGREYSNCKNDRITEYDLPKPTYLFGLTLGISATPLRFKDQKAIVQPHNYPSLAPEGYYLLESLESEKITASSVFIGASVSILPANNKRVSFGAQINFVNRKWKLPSENLEFNNFYADVSPSMQYNFRLGELFQPYVDFGVNIGWSLSNKFISENVTKTFVRVTQRKLGDTWPDEFPVNLPLLSSSQYKPTFYSPFITLGLSGAIDKSIISFGYRHGMNATLTKTPLYETSMGYKVFFVNIKTKLKA
ncbi:MAG: hypothetical protein ABJH04_09920 [Cyclobacteriaceae bacterium]